MKHIIITLLVLQFGEHTMKDHIFMEVNKPIHWVQMWLPTCLACYLLVGYICYLGVKYLYEESFKETGRTTKRVQ